MPEHRIPSAHNAYDIAFGPFFAFLHLNITTHTLCSFCIRSRNTTHSFRHFPHIYMRISSSFHFSPCNIFGERLRLKFLLFFRSLVVGVCVLFAGNITFNAKYLYEVCLRVRAWMMQAYTYRLFLRIFFRRLRVRMSLFFGGLAWFHSVFQHSNNETNPSNVWCISFKIDNETEKVSKIHTLSHTDTVGGDDSNLNDAKQSY